MPTCVVPKGPIKRADLTRERSRPPLFALHSSFTNQPSRKAPKIHTILRNSTYDPLPERADSGLPSSAPASSLWSFACFPSARSSPVVASVRVTNLAGWVQAWQAWARAGGGLFCRVSRSLASALRSRSVPGSPFRLARTALRNWSSARAPRATRSSCKTRSTTISKRSLRYAHCSRSSNNVTRREFATFSESILEGRTAILAMSWIPRISHAERVAHEQAAVRDGLAGYRIKSVTAAGLVPSAVRDEYFPMAYSTREPRTPPSTASISTTAAYARQTLERARDHDGMATSPDFRLQVGVGNRNGFFVVLPVYRLGQPTATVQERRDNLSAMSRAYSRQPC